MTRMAIRKNNKVRAAFAVFVVSLPAMLGAGAQNEDNARLALRVEHFTAPPATGPVVHVLAANLGEEPYEGAVRLDLPEGWAWSPAEQAVSLATGETKRVPFVVERATNLNANEYPVRVTAVSAGVEVVREQTVVCASAPYGKLEIDGDLADWADSLPVAFGQDGKTTTLRTLWNRRTFYLAVEVEEVALAAGDAVQFAVASSKAETGRAPGGRTERFEFVVAGKPPCYVLDTPGMPLSTAAQPRALESLDTVDAEVAVVHRDGTTYYECAIPFAAMDAFRPSAGREFCFSVLVHDADGNGLRDWGAAAGLWPSQRNPLAWCLWDGVQWGDPPPYDGKIEWGLCSSIH